MTLNSIPTPMWFLLWVFVGYVLSRVYNHNRRLKFLETKWGPDDRKRVISKLLAAGVITSNQARELLFHVDCTCEDLTTPAYPEFAAVMFDPDCPIHGDKNENDA